MQFDNFVVNRGCWDRGRSEVIALARQGSKAGPATDGKSEATVELMLEVAQCFFKIRALGQKAGFITGWGGGAFGFLRSLALLGPLTVPQIARMRPTSRQRMQRLTQVVARRPASPDLKKQAEEFLATLPTAQFSRKHACTHLLLRGLRHQDALTHSLDVQCRLGA